MQLEVIKNENRDFDLAKKREEELAWLLEVSTPYSVCLMPKYSKFDYIMHRQGSVCSIGEYRYRDVLPAAYPDISINVDKLDDIRTAAVIMDIKKVSYWVEFADRTVWYASLLEPFETGEIKRNNEERKNDRPEAVYKVPMSSFTRWK